MKSINFLKYNPLFSFIHFISLKMHKRIQYPDQNLEKEIQNSDSRIYKIFLEIDILNSKNEKKEGHAVFKVIFHSSRISAEKFINRTHYTIPFFSGLPGFCTKQFMVNEKENKFSGRYEWETVEMAQKYAHSFALNYMKRRSNPFPIYYEIIDKKSNTIIECSEQ